MRKNINGTSWRSWSLQNEADFTEDTYQDRKIAGKYVRLTNEAVNGDYEELCERLSGNMTILTKKINT
jgi:hypothetical protein